MKSEVRRQSARFGVALPLCLRLLGGCHTPAATCFSIQKRAFRGRVSPSRESAHLTHKVPPPPGKSGTVSTVLLPKQPSAACSGRTAPPQSASGAGCLLEETQKVCLLGLAPVGPGDRWETGPFAHACASVVGVSVEHPSVVGLDWSPVSSNKARGYCCRITWP
jgi:hypothetical protein